MGEHFHAEVIDDLLAHPLKDEVFKEAEYLVDQNDAAETDRRAEDDCQSRLAEILRAIKVDEPFHRHREDEVKPDVNEEENEGHDEGKSRAFGIRKHPLQQDRGRDFDVAAKF